ncbi:Vacuolar protein sorting-associated protein 17 [Malassezia yamatoensis]|uniref:Vacuolar protein sorting-associated protein 17 n=1 Tax=Malassezia yamatoensis TaxID=253288 RepID=A0AAJ5YRQ1_9BASI|nr:Vacuolar protein sorting-associated protein 17 [Malassezia yamatoensis]
MPSFCRNQFQNVERSYRELAMYASALSLIGPDVIVPALPLPTPSMIHMPDAGYEGGVRELHELRIMVGLWFERIFHDAKLRAHRETRRFIEAQYSYEPLPIDPNAPEGQRKQAKKALAQIQSLSHVFTGELFSDRSGSSSVGSMLKFRSQPKPTPAGLVPVHLAAISVMRVNDPDYQLTTARVELMRLEKQLSEVVQATSQVSQARDAMLIAMQDVADAFLPLATLEESRGESIRGRLPRTLRSANSMYANVGKLSKIIVRTSPLIKTHAEEVTLRDALSYQESNLRAARLVLQERTSILVEYDIAQRITRSKRNDADQLRLAPQVKKDRVDAAIEEVREVLERYLGRISQSLRNSLRDHSVNTHRDLQVLMLEHVRISGVYEKQVQDILGLFDLDLSAAAQDAQKATMERASAPRKITPAQAAAARVVKGNQADTDSTQQSHHANHDAIPTAPAGTGTTGDASLANDSPPSLNNASESSTSKLPADDRESATEATDFQHNIAAAVETPVASERGSELISPTEESLVWEKDTPQPVSIISESASDVWTTPFNEQPQQLPAPIDAPPLQPEWSESGEQSPEDIPTATHLNTPSETPNSTNAQPHSLFQSRLSSGRRFGGLSASEAAKSLGGTF